MKAKRTRQNFDEIKEEIARGWYYRTLTSKEIEARGIKMSNVHRWKTEFFGAGPRPPKQQEEAAAPPAPVKAAAESPYITELQSLSKRKIKRGPNGRYDEAVKAKVMPALLQMPVPTVSELTGIRGATLYLWKYEAEKKVGKSNGHALVALPEKASALEPARLPARRAEILVNPETSEQLLESIRRSEGFVNIKKSVENKLAAFRAGTIDLDEDDHRLCMGFLQITGGARARR